MGGASDDMDSHHLFSVCGHSCDAAATPVVEAAPESVCRVKSSQMSQNFCCVASQSPYVDCCSCIVRPWRNGSMCRNCIRHVRSFKYPCYYSVCALQQNFIANAMTLQFA